MDINKEINQLITTIQKGLKNRLKERNQYIHNLKWEHHRQLEKYREENEQLKEELEQLKKMNQKNYQQVLHYKKQYKLFGEGCFSHLLTGEQQVRLKHGLLPYS